MTYSETILCVSAQDPSGFACLEEKIRNMKIDEPKTSGLIHSVTKALNILKCLRSDPQGVVGISRIVNLNKVTVHRMLKTMESAGFVAQDPKSRKYYLGSEIAALAGNMTVAHQKLIAAAYQEMVALRDLTGETVCLNVQTGMQYMCIEEMASLQHVKFSVGRGYEFPIYFGASGKNMLAQLPTEDLDRYIRGITLSLAGPNTITRKKDLRLEIRKARRQGYAVSSGEGIPWGSALSVPIRTYIIPATLSVVGPDQRWTKRMLDFLQDLKEARDRIEERIKS